MRILILVFLVGCSMTSKPIPQNHQCIDKEKPIIVQCSSDNGSFLVSVADILAGVVGWLIGSK